MELQSIFDTVVNHLRQQGGRAECSLNGVCQYRAPNGFKCAVGCLISDEEYRPEIEGTTVRYLLAPGDRRHVPGLTQKLDHADKVELARELQGIHDSTHISAWEACFQRTAIFFGLTYTPPLNKENL